MDSDKGINSLQMKKAQVTKLLISNLFFKQFVNILVHYFNPINSLNRAWEFEDVGTHVKEEIGPNYTRIRLITKFWNLFEQCLFE